LNFAPHIRVNAIAPALVSTSLLDKVSQQRVADYRQGELLKDPILPEDVADTVAFLLSEQSRCYTGAVFDINNGHYRR
jgi:3-oxoacyl-[acyl-carrier protein] reductase